LACAVTDHSGVRKASSASRDIVVYNVAEPSYISAYEKRSFFSHEAVLRINDSRAAFLTLKTNNTKVKLIWPQQSQKMMRRILQHSDVIYRKS
jgi:hypothetical protein